jgi:hypothetical protein
MRAEASKRCRAVLAGSTTACCATATSRQCSPEALALYVFLVCAADAQGLSYYSEPRIAQVLRLEPQTLRQARRELLGLGLIAYQHPLYQLLSLQDEPTAGSSAPRLPRDEPAPTTSNPRGLPLKAAVERLLQQTGKTSP